MQVFRGSDDFIASASLQEAVNVAIALEKPLLIKGEPGTGKTVLAEAIAASLKAPLLTWHIKSTTKAQDGLYIYDTVQRLNDARFNEGDVKDIRRYIRWGALGQAFTSAERCVVLIDEIDKADLEFPNDLLHELDRMSFRVVETDDVVSAQQRPVTIITSNNEKELPDAFLRRCVFHYIEFPNQELMERIVRVHHPKVEEALLQQCLQAFYWLRQQPGLRKAPSTSELIDWVAALQKGGIPTEQVSETFPFLGTLLKHEGDHQTFARRRKKRDPDSRGH